jgi:hypothetical protein
MARLKPHAPSGAVLAHGGKADAGVSPLAARQSRTASVEMTSFYGAKAALVERTSFYGAEAASVEMTGGAG